ncbi:MAG TPA: WD40 repeat domain-containing protein, partial [Thermoanaerobaculia bacterium]
KQRAETEQLQARASEAAANAARLESEGRRSEAVQERERADKLRLAAEDSERETKRLGRLSFARALSLQLARPQPDGQLDDQPGRDLAALLALQVFRLNRQNGGEPQDPDLFNALHAALSRLRPDPVLRLQDTVRAATFVGDGTTLVTGSEDGKLLRFDLRKPDSPEIIGTTAKGLRSTAVSTDGTLLAAGSADGSLRIWNLRQPGSPPRELASGPEPSRQVLAALAFEPHTHRLASGDQGGLVRLWDLDHPEAPPLRLDAAGRRVTSLAFSPDGRLLAAGLSQGGALLWEAPSPQIPPQAPPQAACTGKDVRSVAFSPDGKLLSCGGGRGEIVLWNPATASAAASLPGHLSSVNALSFDPKGDALVSASSDGTVRRWDIRRPGTPPITLSGHESWVWTVSFSPAGDRIVSGGSDKTVRLWPATTERLADEICRQVNRSLTPEEWERAMPADLPFDNQRGCPGSL